MFLKPVLIVSFLAVTAIAFAGWGKPDNACSGAYKVLPALRQGNLTIFPVVADHSHNTSGFLTLDEGLRSGDVVVTESGQVQPLMRRRFYPANRDGAQVNRLVLVNNSKRPLILLAGEIVTGGKQDRVIGKDRIVPAESDPIDLSVFCVEPGRWVATSQVFGGHVYSMAAPKVRARAMGDKDQQKVWSEVRASRGAMEQMVVSAAPAAAADIGQTSSYARVMDNKEVQRQVDSVAAPMERSYSSLIHQLKDRQAVGVVVAVNGQLVWSDLFASPELLEKYWPKLVRSYAAEAISSRGKRGEIDEQSAQAFLERMDGTREMVESEPGVYRHSEISGHGYKVFALTSLLPKTGFEVHLAKMAEN
jgi:hypothetical protein